MERVALVFACTLLAVSTAACASTPTVTYAHLPVSPEAAGKPDSNVWSGGGDKSAKMPASTNAADPVDGEFVFALPESSILFPAPAEKSAGSPECLKPPVGSTDGLEGHKWRRCLAGLSPQAVPHGSTDYLYAMRVDKGLSLQVTYQDDPLLVKGITSNYKSPAAATITRIGTEAAAGFGLGGPWGAVGLVLIGEATHAAGAGAVPYLALKCFGTRDEREKCKKENAAAAMAAALPTPDELTKAHLLCSGVDDHIELTAMKATPTLRLPVSLDNSLPDPSGQGCWRQFPQGDDQYSNGGWLYRVIEETKPSGGAKVPPVHYASDGETEFGLTDWGWQSKHLPAEKGAYFPTSSCHAVVLQVVWWAEAAAVAKAGRTNAQHDLGGVEKSYRLRVADPKRLQLMQLTEGSRTINIQACGARSSGVVASNASDDIFNALVTEAKAVRDAQKNYDK